MEIDTAAEAARESARQGDGRFGAQERTDSEVSLKDSSRAARLTEAEEVLNELRAIDRNYAHDAEDRSKRQELQAEYERLIARPGRKTVLDLPPLSVPSPLEPPTLHSGLPGSANDPVCPRASDSRS